MSLKRNECIFVRLSTGKLKKVKYYHAEAFMTHSGLKSEFEMENEQHRILGPSGQPLDR